MDSFPYKESVIGFGLIVYGFETYLNIRQHKKLHETERPVDIKDIVEQDVFTKSRLYGIDKSHFRFASSFIELVQNLLFLYFDAFPYLWNYAGLFIKVWFGFGPEYEIAQSLVFFTIFYLLSTVINLPTSLYSTFVVEQKHGFNKQTYMLFFSDIIKTTGLVLLFGNVILAGFLKVIMWAGRDFPLYVWSFMFAVQLIMITIYPTFIQPLFNQFTTLEDGEVKQKIEELAKSIEFPLTKLYVIDGSKRSSHSNAYFFGLFKNKRIVLFDTLLEHSTQDEILAILGHELGHWKLNHTIKMLCVSQFHLFTIFWVFGKFIDNAAMYKSFGFNSTPILIGFFLFQFLYSPIESVLSFMVNALSRKHEFEADKFATDLGYAEHLRTGLIKLQKKNLGDMNPDPMYSAYHFSHPPLVERLAAIPTEKKKN